MEITKSDRELIDMAADVLRANVDLYEDINVLVACVVKAKSGKIYKGVNIKTSHSICSEQVALGQAFACGEREFDTMVAVKFEHGDKIRIVSPCGLCRYILNNLNIDINVIVEDIENNVDLKVHSTDLLPYPYKRIDTEH